MTLVYRDPTLLASTLTPLVELAEKVGRARSLIQSDALDTALTEVESHIAQQIRAALRDAPALTAASGPVEDEPRTFKVGDRVRISRRSEVWVPAMSHTLGQSGTVAAGGGSMPDDAVRVSLEDGDWWWYLAQDLDLVSPRTTTDVPK